MRRNCGDHRRVTGMNEVTGSGIERRPAITGETWAFTGNVRGIISCANMRCPHLCGEGRDASCPGHDGSGANITAFDDDGRMPRFVQLDKPFKGRHVDLEIVATRVRGCLTFSQLDAEQLRDILGSHSCKLFVTGVAGELERARSISGITGDAVAGGIPANIPNERSDAFSLVR
jgi:hypothetical protein